MQGSPWQVYILVFASHLLRMATCRCIISTHVLLYICLDFHMLTEHDESSRLRLCLRLCCVWLLYVPHANPVVTCIRHNLAVALRTLLVSTRFAIDNIKAVIEDEQLASEVICVTAICSIGIAILIIFTVGRDRSSGWGWMNSLHSLQLIWWHCCMWTALALLPYAILIYFTIGRDRSSSCKCIKRQRHSTICSVIDRD